MTSPYIMAGVTLNLNSHGVGCFDVVNRGTTAANDLGPHGGVPEFEGFLERTNGLRRFMDVGACVGAFSLMFTRHPDAIAWALEPSPWAFPVLLEHCEANPNHRIVPLNLFAGETAGKEIPCARDWLHVISDGGKGDEWHKQYMGKSISGDRHTVHETRIDDIITVGGLDCMKIDVEGWECPVLRGAEKTLLQYKPMIFLECHLGTLAGNGESRDSLFNLVSDLGYRMERHDGVRLKDLHQDGEACQRVVCVPK